MGEARFVRVSRPKKSVTTPALWVFDLTVKERLSGASGVAKPRAERSEG